MGDKFCEIRADPWPKRGCIVHGIVFKVYRIIVLSRVIVLQQGGHLLCCCWCLVRSIGVDRREE